MSKLLLVATVFVASVIAICQPTGAHARERVRGSVVQTTIVRDSTVPLNGYASVERAVIAASNRYNPDSIKRNREHVGAIVACAGALFFTHGKGRPGVTPIRFSIVVPDGCALEALWHTHGGRGRHRRYFSPSDTSTADKLDVPFYLANYKGELRVFHPGESFARQNDAELSKPGIPIGAAVGETVEVGRSTVTVATR